MEDVGLALGLFNVKGLHDEGGKVGHCVNKGKKQGLEVNCVLGRGKGSEVQEQYRHPRAKGLYGLENRRNCLGKVLQIIERLKTK